MRSVSGDSPRTVEITDVRDPADGTSSFGFLDQDLVQLPSASPFNARQVIVRLEGCVLVHYETDIRVRTRPTLQSDYIAVVAFGPGATGTADGLAVRGDVMLAVPAGHSLAVVAEPGYQSASFLVRPEVLVEHLSVRGRSEALPHLEQVQFLSVGDGRSGRLYAWARRLVDAVLEQPDLLEESAERRAAVREDLLETLLSALASGSAVALDQRERTRQAHSGTVRAAETYALAHADERVYVKDLCQAAGVSERTLDNAFRAEMGISPMAYLTRIRLHRVHESLLRGSPTATTVSGEALRWGFWHFGEFANAYKDCFQELPSDTLRRPRPG